MSAKFILHTLKGYIMLYIITKFRDSEFSQSEVKVGGSFASPPEYSEARSKKPTQNMVKKIFLVCYN